MTNLNTKNTPTWCPGCSNFGILDAMKKVIEKLVAGGFARQEQFVMATGIGCHAKIFDYLNIGGIYGLHGRVLPTALGMKLGNPDLVVLGFGGDGDTYAEGVAHFVHNCRYNADMTMVVHDNRAFSLTTGQATPTSQQGYESKAQPFGVVEVPMNPVKLALASGASFIARVSAKDLAHMQEIFEKAIKHKGFAFVEVLQDCLIFNVDVNNLDKNMYKIKDNKDRKVAEKLASEWDYNSVGGRIPVGVLFVESRKTLEEGFFGK